MNEIITGIFRRECSGRFLCEVEIDGNNEFCYVASSAKLKNYVNLINKKVYLKKNKGKNTRTKYSLFAMEDDNGKVVLLNLNQVNDLLKDYLIEKGFEREKLKSEITLDNGLKVDLAYLGYTNIIYEAKTILSKENKAIFPSAKTKRVKTQLETMVSMLVKGYYIKYCFIILNEDTSMVEIDRENVEIYTLFYEAIRLKIDISFYRTYWNGTGFFIEEDKALKENFRYDKN